MEPPSRPVEAVQTDRPVAALGLVVGPAAFIAIWLVGGALTPDYSPIDDAISRIAAVGAPRRWLMTLGFVVFGLGLGAGSVALRSGVLRRCAPLAAVNAVAAFAVALTPLERSDAVDALHGLSAAVGYVTLAAIPLVAAGPLRALGRPRRATISVVVGVCSAACLVATVFVDANGFFQRLGLGVVDVWLMVLGLELYRRGRRSS